MSMQACVEKMKEVLSLAGVSQQAIGALVGNDPPDKALMEKLIDGLPKQTAGPTNPLGTCTFICDGVTFERETTLHDCKSFCPIDPDTKWGGVLACPLPSDVPPD